MELSEENLKKILLLIYDKVRSIQNGNNFDTILERERNKTYIGMPDNYFFQQLCDLIFQSGVRGQVWAKYEPEIRKEFSNYNVRKVARYTKKDIERMLKNPKMLKNRRKIEACVYNAKKIVPNSNEYSGFWKWLDSQVVKDGDFVLPKVELVEKIQSTFKMLTGINAYGFLRYVGLDVIKPDLEVVRVLFRLGLIDNDKKKPETYKQIQEVGKIMAKACGVKMAVVDFTLFMFGSGEKPFVKFAVCGTKPKCEECSVKEFCKTSKDYT
jgi:DNA-3-methyladenine glycosylase I